MSYSLVKSLRKTTLDEPRIQLLGASDNEIENFQIQMPSLDDVRNDATSASEFLKNPVLPTIHVATKNGEDLGTFHPAIAYHHMFPNLYKFSFLCHEDDVPEDIIHDCLWALRQRLIGLAEAPESQLRWILPHDENGNIDAEAKSVMDARTRIKIAAYCLSPQINLPEEALVQLESDMTIQEKRGFAETCLGTAESDAQYGAILARTRSRDTDARRILERVHNELEANQNDERPFYLIQSKVYLSRVLRRLGAVSEASTHEAYLVKWLKKNSTRIPDKHLRQWFETEPGVDPVYEALGGTKWMKKRNAMTSKNFIRQTRACYNCGFQENPSVSKKLMRCSKCQFTVYCSRECQREHYPFHKITCRDRMAERSEVEDLNINSAEDARCIDDWNRYKRSGFDGNNVSFHALGLHHNLDRGKTHILVKKVRYVPDGGRDILHRFEIEEAGVFRIREVLDDLDFLMDCGRGGTAKGMGMLRKDFGNGPGKAERIAEYFNFFISDDSRISTYLSIAGVSPKAKEALKHEPNWRNHLNVGKRASPAKPLTLPSGAQDAEYDYLALQSRFPSEVRPK
ncbi:hypothetical protein V5O48_006351 [Marasmius crinis-equi]|uniref:MYND-type domain-containing protein n=1 Tax=Marasmius crinis-equi TaxID=585013 RepID=A0ABR3FJQ9_9AGAR